MKLVIAIETFGLEQLLKKMNHSLLSPNSSLLNLNSLSTKDLEVLIKHLTPTIDLDDVDTIFERIMGGIALYDNDQLIIYPTCCSDLSEISNWFELSNTADNEWHMLWVGHPWIFYKRENKTITLSDYYECNIEDIDNIKTLIQISEEDLKNKLAQIQEKVTLIKSLISKSLSSS